MTDPTDAGREVLALLPPVSVLARLDKGQQFNAYEGHKSGWVVGIGPVTDFLGFARCEAGEAAEWIVAHLRAAFSDRERATAGEDVVERVARALYAESARRAVGKYPDMTFPAWENALQVTREQWTQIANDAAVALAATPAPQADAGERELCAEVGWLTYRVSELEAVLRTLVDQRDAYFHTAAAWDAARAALNASGERE